MCYSSFQATLSFSVFFGNPKQALSRLLPLNGGIKSAKRKGFKGRGIQGILTLDL
jgi:hypothetical protein